MERYYISFAIQKVTIAWNNFTFYFHVFSYVLQIKHFVIFCEPTCIGFNITYFCTSNLIFTRA